MSIKNLFEFKYDDDDDVDDKDEINPLLLLVMEDYL